jgi:hypothetical protein
VNQSIGTPAKNKPYFKHFTNALKIPTIRRKWFGKALASGTSPKFKTKMMSELPSLELLSTTKNFDWCVYALIILLPTGYGREGKIPHSDPVKVPGHGSWVEVVSRGRKGASVRLKSSYQSKIAVSLHALLNGPWVV